MRISESVSKSWKNKSDLASSYNTQNEISEKNNLLFSLRSTDVRQSTWLNSYMKDSNEDPRLFMLRLK